MQAPSASRPRDAATKSGTDGSNPVPSSGESSELHTGVYALLGLTFVLVWMDSALDRETVWERLDYRSANDRSGRDLAGAVGCETCGLVSAPQYGDDRCPGCESVLHDRVRLHSQPLDFVEPSIEFLVEMLTQFGRKLEANQLDEVFVDRVRQTSNDLLDVPFWVCHFQNFFDLHLFALHHLRSGTLGTHVFSSRFTWLRNRQSVPSAMIFCGLDLMKPASCRRKA
jgi:hypothetical protein